MFCPNCGTNVEEKVAFCPNCGTALPQETAETPAAEATPVETPVEAVAAEATPASKDFIDKIMEKLPLDKVPFKVTKKLFTLISGGIIALLTLIILIAALSGGAKSVTNKTMRAVLKTGNGKVIVNALPKKVVQASDMSKKAIIRQQNERLDDILDEMDEERIKASWKVSDTTKLDKYDIHELENRYKSTLDGRTFKISAAKEIEYKVTFKERGNKDTMYVTLTAIKVNGKWCLDIFSYNNLLYELY